MVTTQNTYTIMILDDEEDILTLYSDYLSNMGHRYKVHMSALIVYYRILVSSLQTFTS
ncbi:MAG: hypothetical protein ACM3ZS_05960 [Nitrososphaerota archaeon]